MKHTKGPWKARNHHIYAEDTDIHIADICRARDGDWSPANARLIASAPELLEALLTIRSDNDFSYETEYDGCMYSMCMFCDGQDGEHEKDCTKKKVNQAIAKAEGERNENS